MAVPLFTNNASATLAGSYTSGATAITVNAGQGTQFPAPTGGDWFMATIVDSLNNIEIVKVTAKATDTFTVVRGQEGTSARALAAGEKFELRVTASVLEALRDKQTTAANIDDNAVTTPKIADSAVTAAKIANGAINAAAKLADGVVSAVKLAAGAAVANLGFTPVQQGGGTGQTSDKIYIGWSEPKLRAQVGSTDQGFILTERQDGSPHSAGYRGLPPNIQNANYQLGLSDLAKGVLHTSGTHAYTVPADSTPFEAGAVIEVVNDGGGLTIVPASGVALVWSPSGTLGSRTLAFTGVACLQKISANRWYIYGTGLT